MQNRKTVNCILPALLVAAWIVQLAMGVTHTGVPPVDALMHANWAHLALNCWVAYSLWREPRWLIVPAFAIGCFGLWLDREAVGFSATLYALMGLQWHLYDCVRNRVIVAASLLVAGMVPQLAFVAHLVPFAIALAVGYAARLICNYNQDVNRR